jgi:hypothetical protein
LIFPGCNVLNKNLWDSSASTVYTNDYCSKSTPFAWVLPSGGVICTILILPTLHVHTTSYSRKKQAQMYFAKKQATVSGSLDSKWGSRCHVLLYKRWHLLPPFCLTNPAQVKCKNRETKFGFYFPEECLILKRNNFVTLTFNVCTHGRDGCLRLYILLYFIYTVEENLFTFITNKAFYT